MLCLGMIMYFLLARGDLALFILLKLQFLISVDYGNYYESCMYIVDIMWAANSIYTPLLHTIFVATSGS